MPYLNDDIFDDGENELTNKTENLYVLSGDPGLTWSNIAALGLGVKSSPVVSSPADRVGGGREVTISAITDGVGTAVGNAAYWALTDDSATKILASGDLAAPVSMKVGSIFTLTEFTIAIPDP
jgi:hypothetical protein